MHIDFQTFNSLLSQAWYDGYEKSQQDNYARQAQDQANMAQAEAVNLQKVAEDLKAKQAVAHQTEPWAGQISGYPIR